MWARALKETSIVKTGVELDFPWLSCRKQEEYRIAKGEEERDLYATEKKKSFESLEKVHGNF